MIVGKAHVDLKELKKHYHDKDEFIKYCDSLVPEAFKHCDAIVNNQRYICCLMVRKSDMFLWDIKKPMLNEVLPTIKISGFTDCLVEADTLFEYANMDKVNKYLKR